jgi:hypothetical protein
MRTYIHAHGFQVWQSIVDGYTTPTVPPTNEKAVKLGENNSKSTNAILNGISDTIFTKVAHCKSTKEIWDKLQIIYEGDPLLHMGGLFHKKFHASTSFIIFLKRAGFSWILTRKFVAISTKILI